MTALLIKETEKRLVCLSTQTFFGNVNSFFVHFSSSRNQFGRLLSVWKPCNAAAFRAISILHAYITAFNKWFDKLKQWLCTSGTYTFYSFCHNCRTLEFAVRAWFICHSLCRGERLGAQARLWLRHLWHLQPLSKRVSSESIIVRVKTVKKFWRINFVQFLKKERR